MDTISIFSKSDWTVYWKIVLVKEEYSPCPIPFLSKRGNETVSGIVFTPGSSFLWVHDWSSPTTLPLRHHDWSPLRRYGPSTTPFRSSLSEVRVLSWAVLLTEYRLTCETSKSLCEVPFTKALDSRMSPHLEPLYENFLCML